MATPKLADVHIIGLKRTLVHFRKIIANLPKMNESMISDFASDVVKTAKRNVEERATYKNATKTGNLKNSITVKKLTSTDNGAKGTVGVQGSVAERYAYYFEEGVHGGDTIKPVEFFPGVSYKQSVKKPVLRFYWADGPDGPGVYYFRSVTRGSFKGRHFMRDAAIKVSDDMREKVDKRVGSLIEK